MKNLFFIAVISLAIVQGCATANKKTSTSPAPPAATAKVKAPKSGTSETLSATAKTEAECAYDFEQAKSALNEKSPQYKFVGKVSIKEKTLSQKASFEDSDISVEFSESGCAHYNYSFHFSHLSQKNFTSDQAFAKSIELLKATPVTTEGADLVKTLVSNLQAAKLNKIFRPPNKSYDFPCGDAQCTLDASKKGHLVISYSFAL